MARSDTITLLSLDRYSQIMQIVPTHFNQLGGAKAPVTVSCPNAIWDQTARDALAWSISRAEEMIAEYLNFWPSPKFFTSDDFNDSEIMFGLPGIRGDWWNAEVETRWGMVECFGTEQLTLVQAGANVIYSDADNDPLEREELATISSTGLYVEELTACDNKCEVALFFREADGAEDPADPCWEIKPITVDIDGSTMSITAEASQFVKPELWDLTKQDSAGSPDTNAYIIDYDTSNLVSQVDVYCRTVNKATPITVKWDGVCNCAGVCAHATQTACAQVTDKRRSFFRVRPATWNGTSNVYTTPLHYFAPESVLANYRAGMPLDRKCKMNTSMEAAIVKLANALLPEPPCGFCDVSKSIWDEDRKEVDPALLGGFPPPWDMFRKGAFEAWKIVQLFMQGVGGKAGRGYR